MMTQEDWMNLRALRPLQEAGYSYQAIADIAGCDWRTAKRYLENDKGVPAYGPRRSPGKLIDPFTAVIDTWLRAEIKLKGTTIHERLAADPYNFPGSYQRVKQYLRSRRPQIAAELGLQESAPIHRRFETIAGAQADSGSFRQRRLPGKGRLTMQLADDALIVSASDLTGFLACHHLTALELQAAEGLVKKPHRRDPLVDLLSKKGDEHEARQLAQFEADGLTIVQVPRAPTVPDLLDAERRTLQAMKDGVDVVYQATFFDGGWRGHADFLRRVEVPSDLGAYSYEVHDAKLARSPKGRAVLQLCVYSNQLARLQGTTPEWMHLILGDNSVQSFKVNDYAAYYRTIDRAFDEFVAAPSATYPDPVEHCQVCRWWGNCIDRRRSDDHLSLVAGIRNDQIKKLDRDGITTLAALGTEDPARKIVGIPSVSFERLQDQAAMQMLGRSTGKPEYRIVSPPGAELGLEMLPEPTEADIFFDIEGDPYVGDEGLNFLFGLTSLEKGHLAYRSWWAHTPAEEKAMVEAFLDHITAHRAAHPDMHVYHYSPAEPGALKRLVGHYATREEDLDRLLRAQVFVDLYRAVKQGIRISEESYSIKKLEAFYGFTRSDPITKELCDPRVRKVARDGRTIIA